MRLSGVRPVGSSLDFSTYCSSAVNISFRPAAASFNLHLSTFVQAKVLAKSSLGITLLVPKHYFMPVKLLYLAFFIDATKNVHLNLNNDSGEGEVTVTEEAT